MREVEFIGSLPSFGDSRTRLDWCRRGGLDIEGVALVVNWDLPTEPEEHTHRVGRTARMGRTGMAVSFVTERDEERVQRVEARIGIKLGSPRGWESTDPWT